MNCVTIHLSTPLSDGQVRDKSIALLSPWQELPSVQSSLMIVEVSAFLVGDQEKA